MKTKIIILVALRIAVGLFIYSMLPKYPDELETMTWTRKLGALTMRAVHWSAIQAERTGLITDSAETFQHLFSRFKAELPNTQYEDVSFESTEIAGVPVVIFRPKEASQKNKAIVYFHGGGFVLGSTASHFRWTLRLANETKSIVISVDYRLAPKHPFPAGIEDCVNVTIATFDKAEQLGIDRNRIAVAGDSAGANFAAVVALQLAPSYKYKLEAQILISPVLGVTDFLKLPSHVLYTDIFPLDGGWFMAKYAGISYTREVQDALRTGSFLTADEAAQIRRHADISTLSEDLLALIHETKESIQQNVEASTSSFKKLEKPAERSPELEALAKFATDEFAWPLLSSKEGRMKKMAPVFFQICEFDLLRDESLIYLQRLRNLGVETTFSFAAHTEHVGQLMLDMRDIPDTADTLKARTEIFQFVNDQL